MAGGGLGWGRGGRGEGREGEGKWKGGKGRAPKLLLNQDPSESCYATGDSDTFGLTSRNLWVFFVF